MFKLILVFGVWINPYQIAHMEQKTLRNGLPCNTTWVFTSCGNKHVFSGLTVEQVAQEINKQMENNNGL